MIDFDLFSTKALILTFPCKRCGATIETGELPVPSPDYTAEKASDSNNFEVETIICSNEACEEEYEVTIYVSFYGGDLEVEGIDDDDMTIQIVPNEEQEQYYREYYGSLADIDQIYPTFIQSIKNLRALNEMPLPDQQLHGVLKRQIFMSLIATLEAFLSETFIKFTLADTKYLKAFVASYPEFKKRRFELRTIFDTYDEITNIAKNVMLDMIYHNLPKVKLMYEQTFGIKFPAIEPLIRAVAVRHDIVHRNGKTKDGNIHEFSAADIETYIVQVENFVEEITNLLLFRPLNPDDTNLPDIFKPL